MKQVHQLHQCHYDSIKDTGDQIDICKGEAGNNDIEEHNEPEIKGYKYQCSHPLDNILPDLTSKY